MKQIWQWLVDWLSYVIPAIDNLLLFFVGVALSFSTVTKAIEDNPKRFKTLAWFCAAVGLIGFCFEVNNRRSEDVSTAQLINRTRVLVDNTNDLATRTQGIRTVLDSIEPEIEEMNGRFTTLPGEIETAHRDGNSAALSRLKQEKATKLAALLALKPLFVANLRSWWHECDAEDIRLNDRLDMTPYGDSSEREKIIRLRNDLRTSCHSDDVRPTLTSAYYLQNEVLSGIPETKLSTYDRDARIIFVRAFNGGPTGYSDIRTAANYLEGLSARNAR